MPSLRDALEAALVENPDDLATHHAYADYLQEQGDPRGEFIQVQLALEETTSRTKAERRRLKAREQELLGEHGREWLGVLADELLGVRGERRKGADKLYEIQFARGWLDSIVRRSNFPPTSNLGHLLSQAKAARLLRVLALGGEDLAGVRAIVQSPYLHNLNHLLLFSSDLGDVGCTEIATSGILKRLRMLSLFYCDITDAGARILADCPDLKRLESLYVIANTLTQTGIDALRRVLGNALEVDEQQMGEEPAQERHISVIVKSTPGDGYTRSGRRRSQE